MRRAPSRPEAVRRNVARLSWKPPCVLMICATTLALCRPPVDAAWRDGRYSSGVCAVVRHDRALEFRVGLDRVEELRCREPRALQVGAGEIGLDQIGLKQIGLP